MDSPEVNKTLSGAIDLTSTTDTTSATFTIVRVESSAESDVLPGLMGQLLHDVLVIIIARVGLPSIGIFGIITNTINLLVFWSMGLKDSVTSSFFVLSLADWCYLFASFFGWSFSLLGVFNFQQTISLSDLSYITVWYSLMFLAMSVFLTTYIAVQRCCCVALPFQFKGVFTTKRNAVVIAIICLTSVALYIPILSKMGLKENINVQTNASIIAIWYADDWNSVITIKDFLVGLWMPISTQVINVICMFILITGLRNSSRFRNSTGIPDSKSVPDSKSAKSSTKEIQIAKAVAVVTFMFIVSNMAPICQALARRAESGFAMYRRFGRIFFVIVLIKHALQHLNASLNLFVYLKFNSTFRNTLKEMIKLKRTPVQCQT